MVEKVDQTALVEQEIHLLLVHLKEMMVEQVQEDLKLKLLVEVEVEGCELLSLKKNLLIQLS